MYRQGKIKNNTVCRREAAAFGALLHMLDLTAEAFSDNQSSTGTSGISCINFKEGEKTRKTWCCYHKWTQQICASASFLHEHRVEGDESTISKIKERGRIWKWTRAISNRQGRGRHRYFIRAERGDSLRCLHSCVGDLTLSVPSPRPLPLKLVD